MIIFITLLLPLFYFILSRIDVIWGIAVLFLFYLMRGLATPVLKDYINRLTESSTRATVLSVRNFMIRLFFAGIGPFLGWYTDHFSLSQALALASIAFFVLAVVAGGFFLKTRRYTHRKMH